MSKKSIQNLNAFNIYFLLCATVPPCPRGSKRHQFNRRLFQHFGCIFVNHGGTAGTKETQLIVYNFNLNVLFCC